MGLVVIRDFDFKIDERISFLSVLQCELEYPVGAKKSQEPLLDKEKIFNIMKLTNIGVCNLSTKPLVKQNT